MVTYSFEHFFIINYFFTLINLNVFANFVFLGIRSQIKLYFTCDKRVV